MKEEVVDHGEGDEDVGVKQEVGGGKVKIERIEIKRCELMLSRVKLAKPGEGLEVIKPRLSQAPQRVGGPLNGLNRQVRANQQRSGAKKTQPTGVHQAGDRNQVRLVDGVKSFPPKTYEVFLTFSVHIAPFTGKQGNRLVHLVTQGNKKYN